MRCPSCGASVADDAATFCSRCGSPLQLSDTERTAELSTRPGAEGRPSGETVETETKGSTLTDGEVKAPRSSPVLDLVRDFSGALRHGFSGGGWADLAGAAGFGFVALIAVGALAVAAAKLQYADLGAEADPVSILSALVITGLGVLRVPISIGDLTVSALPLGGLLLAGSALAWATARAVRKGDITEPQATLLQGAKVALPFALICWVAALIFRIRVEPTPVFAHAPSALLLAALWGLFFGIAGALIASAPLRSHMKEMLRDVKGHWRSIYEGIVAGGVMLLITLVLAALAALVWIIVGLATGRPEGDFGAGEGLAAFIYIVLFAPNIVTAITAIGLGANVEVGAQVTAGGEMVGPLHSIGIWDWAGGPAPWFVFFLILIPLLACLLGGFAARRATREPKRFLEVLGAAAFTYALALFELAALSEARLGAGLVRERGFGRVAPEPGLVFIAALLWALAAGYMGWRIAASGHPQGMARRAVARSDAPRRDAIGRDAARRGTTGERPSGGESGSPPLS